ncbi:thermonuclease family protein [Thermocoleostomius sinensis]|uniref:Thermonuclease family protein n=1 Tax=Thermocoleostomius sinensis A174 TaxID=2016057 RepID=A0A9E8ZGC3_9CYAN|nr:thermonuclease family protein [Thermocoleostomius sinensis]WAL62271.1 thermonuclease family protein [Thermocoleostomius sinensis A174]
MKRWVIISLKILPPLLSAIVLLGCQSCSWWSQPSKPSLPAAIEAQVVSVHDGDTMRVLLNGEEERIRLCGIDAPELKQRLGEASRDHLRSLVNTANQHVIVTIVDIDRYGRKVAEVSQHNGKILNVEQIKSGNAYLYRQYASRCPHNLQMEQAEFSAQRSRIGVWKYPNALKPWEYRKKQRSIV